jgi:hypothetical protein
MVADGGAVIKPTWLNTSLAYWSILLIHQNFMCLGFQDQTWEKGSCLSFFRKINAWLSAAHRSKPALFSASVRFIPGGIFRASCRASTAIALWLRLSGEASRFTMLGLASSQTSLTQTKKCPARRGWVPTQGEKVGSVSLGAILWYPYDLASG